MRWKWIVLGICGLAVVFMIALYVILSTYNFNSLKPQIAKAAKEATGRELTLGGDIRLKIGLTPALVVENASFQNAPWGSRPDMARIKRFEFQVALLPLISKRIELKRLVLIEPDILIESDKSGKLNLDFETGSRKKEIPGEPQTSPAGKEMNLPSLLVNEFEMTKGLVSYRDGRTGKTVVVALDSLTAKATDLDSPTRLKLKGSYNSEPFEAEGTLGPLAGMMDSSKPWPLHLNGKAFGATLTLDGSIKEVRTQRGIDLSFALKGSDLATLGKASGKALPLKGPFDISGRVSDPAPKAYKISNLKVAIGESDLAGTVEVHMAGERPRVTAVLSSQKLDMRSMMPEGANSGKSKGPSKSPGEPARETRKREKLFPDDPLPLEGMSQVDANVKFQAGQILLSMLALNKVSADVNLENGHLLVKPIKGLMGGGSMEAQFDLQLRGKTAMLGALIKVDQLDLGRILKEVKGIEALDGRLNADISIKGRGASVAGIMGSLDGKSVMTMDQGKIDNKYLDMLGGDIGSGLFRLLGLSRDSKTTTVNCFVSGFIIKDGRADTTALVIDTDQMSMVGDGEINLRNETLNLALIPSPKGGVGTSKTGKVTTSLGELAKTFKLSGTFAHPSLGIDTTQTAVTIGKMVGGTALLGPLGLAAPLVTGSQTNEKLCPLAVEAARKGVKMSGGKSEKKTETGPAQTPAQGMKELGKELQKLFGK